MSGEKNRQNSSMWLGVRLVVIQGAQDWKGFVGCWHARRFNLWTSVKLH